MLIKECRVFMSTELQLEGRGDGEDAERHGAGFPSSRPQACSLNSKELVLQLFVSQLSMVRSVKVTLPSASIRMTVLVLKVRGHSGYKQSVLRIYR